MVRTPSECSEQSREGNGIKSEGESLGNRRLKEIWPLLLPNISNALDAVSHAGTMILEKAIKATV